MSRGLEALSILIFAAVVLSACGPEGGGAKAAPEGGARPTGPDAVARAWVEAFRAEDLARLESLSGGRTRDIVAGTAEVRRIYDGLHEALARLYPEDTDHPEMVRMQRKDRKILFEYYADMTLDGRLAEGDGPDGRSYQVLYRDGYDRRMYRVLRVERDEDGAWRADFTDEKMSVSTLAGIRNAAQAAAITTERVIPMLEGRRPESLTKALELIVEVSKRLLQPESGQPSGGGAGG